MSEVLAINGYEIYHAGEGFGDPLGDVIIVIPCMSPILFLFAKIGYTKEIWLLNKELKNILEEY